MARTQRRRNRNNKSNRRTQRKQRNQRNQRKQRNQRNQQNGGAKKGSRRVNKYFQLMMNAKKNNLESFEYNGKTYKRQQKGHLTFYKA